MSPCRGLVVGCSLVLLAGCDPGETPATAATPPQARSGQAAVVLPADSPQLRQIKVEAVETRSVATDEVIAAGRVGIDPNRTSRLLLPVPGRVVAVLVRLGDTVDRGQPVLSVESPDADAAIAALAQAEAAERQSAAALVKAQGDLQRAQDLYQMRAVPEKDVLGAQNDVAQARAAVDTAQAARGQARRKLEHLGLSAGDTRPVVQVRAPIAGKVLEISVAPGEYRNDTGTPLMTIADLNRVWISSDVPEAFIRFIRVGDQVSISLVAYPGETFAGRIARVADVLDPQTRTLKVHVEMANPQGRFRPEMFGSIRHSGATRAAPAIPTAAVVQEYGRPVVYVERGPGRFERREVTLGPRAGDVVAVLRGVEAGDRVVVDGAVLLKDQ